uniref:Uncharacterized protein n=1 Tax=Lepeophtheirus salmonis TaxID=72036 RepID=A0A0K2VL76_LEPSM
MRPKQNLSKYEQLQKENIVQNNEKMIELGLRSRNQVSDVKYYIYFIHKSLHR